MIGFILVAAAQIVVPSAEGLDLAERAVILGKSKVAGTQPVYQAVFAEAGVRLELKRVGLDKGCPIIRTVTREKTDLYRTELTPIAVRTVREVIPDQRLGEFKILTFAFGAAQRYNGRFQTKFEENAHQPLLRLRKETIDAVLSELAHLGRYTSSPDDAPALEPIFQSSFGARPDDVWEKGALTAFACIQRTAAKRNMPTIEHGGQVFPPERKSE